MGVVACSRLEPSSPLGIFCISPEKIRNFLLVFKIKNKVVKNSTNGLQIKKIAIIK